MIAKTMFCLALLAPLGAAVAQAPVKTQQYITILRVAPSLQQDSKWTDKEKATVSRHFERIKEAAAKGQVILAGRTTEPLDKTFGIVIFEADSDAAAKAFVDEDPAVKAGIMTATVHPYTTAAQRK